MIHRWVFDASFNATFNGHFQHFRGIHDLQFAPPSALQVAIDIKPGSFPNSISVESKGVIAVAILSTEGFDASSVVASSARFGPGEAQAVHGGHIDDVSGDGVLDLVLHFRTQETAIPCGDTSASLTGETFSGQTVEGADSVRPVPCR